MRDSSHDVTIKGQPPMTSTFRGYRSDPIPYTNDEEARAVIHAQAVIRWSRSRSRWGRLLNRLLRVRPVAPQSSHKLPLRLVEEPRDN